MIEQYIYNGEGYKPCLIKDNWQAAILNYVSAQGFGNIDKIERHNQTDEIFILFKGAAVLIAVDKKEDNLSFKPINMKQGIMYNIPQSVWHNIVMDKDAEIFIFENANTHINDCEYYLLNKQQKEEMENLIRNVLEK